MGGAILETAVIGEIYRPLTRRGVEPRLYFWRTHGRVFAFPPHPCHEMFGPKRNAANQGRAPSGCSECQTSRLPGVKPEFSRCPWKASRPARGSPAQVRRVRV